MAISKQRKDELVLQYKELIQKSEAIIIAQYGGMTVKEMEALRGKLGEVNAHLNVTKNTLLRIALEESEMPPPLELLNGQVATSFALGDAPSLAKALVEQAKANDKLKIIGGLMGDKPLSKEQIESLATLPSLDQLRAQIIGLVSAPAQGIVSAVTNGVRQIVNVVDAYAKKDEGAGGAPEAEAAAA